MGERDSLLSCQALTFVTGRPRCQRGDEGSHCACACGYNTSTQSGAVEMKRHSEHTQAHIIW